MLAIGPDFYTRRNVDKNFLVVGSSALQAPMSALVNNLIGLAMLAVVGLAAANVLPLIKGLALMLVLLLGLRVVRAGELRRRFPFELGIIIASALDTPGAELAEELGQISQRRVPLLVQIDDAAAHLPSGVYPVRLSDGTRRRMRVAEFRAQGSETEEVFEIPMLHLDAGLNLSEMARQIDQGFASRREARA